MEEEELTAPIGSETEQETGPLSTERLEEKLLKELETHGSNIFLVKYQSSILGIAGIILFVLIWGLASQLNVLPNYLVSSPYLTVLSLYELFASGTIYYHLWFSSQEFLFGYVLAAVSGIILGLVMGWYRRVNYLLDMLVSALYATPRVAFVPLFIVFFGILGIWKTAATVYVMTFFPVLVNTLAGVRLSEASYVKVGKVLGAKSYRLVRDVVIPGSLPSIIAGLRLGTGLGLTALVVGDLYGAQAGLGYLLFLYGNAFRTSDLIAVIVLFALIGVAVNTSLKKLEDHFSSWKPSIAE